MRQQLLRVSAAFLILAGVTAMAYSWTVSISGTSVYRGLPYTADVTVPDHVGYVDYTWYLNGSQIASGQGLDTVNISPNQYQNNLQVKATWVTIESQTQWASKTVYCLSCQ